MQKETIFETTNKIYRIPIVLSIVFLILSVLNLLFCTPTPLCLVGIIFFLLVLVLSIYLHLSTRAYIQINDKEIHVYTNKQFLRFSEIGFRVEHSLIQDLYNCATFEIYDLSYSGCSYIFHNIFNPYDFEDALKEYQKNCPSSLFANAKKEALS